MQTTAHILTTPQQTMARKSKTPRTTPHKKAPLLHTCKTYDIKIQNNKLNKAQKEALTRIFLEAKWIRNDALANGIDEYPLNGTVQVKYTRLKSCASGC